MGKVVGLEPTKTGLISLNNATQTQTTTYITGTGKFFGVSLDLHISYLDPAPATDWIVRGSLAVYDNVAASGMPVFGAGVSVYVISDTPIIRVKIFDVNQAFLSNPIHLNTGLTVQATVDPTVGAGTAPTDWKFTAVPIYSDAYGLYPL